MAERLPDTQMNVLLIPQRRLATAGLEEQSLKDSTKNIVCYSPAFSLLLLALSFSAVPHIFTILWILDVGFIARDRKKNAGIILDVMMV